MADFGANWIDSIFYICVQFLHAAASRIGITYEEINVWLFVFILPTILIVSVALNVWLLTKKR